MPQLIAELKRRNVFRAAAFYAAGDSITHPTAKTLDRWIIATLALIVILLVAAKLVLHKWQPASALEKPVDEAAPGKSGLDEPVARKTIAFLPFENLSEDKVLGGPACLPWPDLCSPTPGSGPDAFTCR